MNYDRKPNVVEGRVYQERNTRRDMVGMLVANSKNVFWKNVNFYYIHGMGIVNQFSENLTFDQVRFAPRSNSQRTASCWADAVQVSSCRGKVVFRNCYFSGTHDDPINIPGTALRIVEKTAVPKQVKVRFMHGQTYGFQPFFPGDEIDFVDSLTMLDYHRNKVVAVTELSPKEWLLTLAKEPAEFSPNHVLDNLTWYPTVDIDGCVVDMCSTRGFLITTTKPVKVRNCTFIRTFMSAILVEGDANGWFESGKIRDLVIENNQFLECSEPVIHINPGTRQTKPGCFVEKNISILGNRFVLKGNQVVSAKSVQGMLVKDNIYSKSGKVSQHASENIREENNQVDPQLKITY